AVFGEDDCVRLDVLAGAPGEAEVAELFLRRLTLAHDLHLKGCVVGAAVGLLDEEAAGNATHVVRQSVAEGNLEDAKVAPARQGLEGALAVLGRDDDLV